MTLYVPGRTRLSGHRSARAKFLYPTKSSHDNNNYSDFIRKFLYAPIRYYLLFYLYMEICVLTCCPRFVTCNIVVDGDLSKEIFRIINAEDPSHFHGARFDGSLKVALTLPDLNHLKSQIGQNRPLDHRLVKRQVPSPNTDNTDPDLFYPLVDKFKGTDSRVAESVTYQADINRNSHSYSTLRRREPISFRREVEARRRKSLLSTSTNDRKLTSSRLKFINKNGTAEYSTLYKYGPETDDVATADLHPLRHNVHIKIFDKSYNISLLRNDRLLGPNFLYTIRNGTHVKNLPVRVPSCYYRGHLTRGLVVVDPLNSIDSPGSLEAGGSATDGNEDVERGSDPESSYAALSTCGGGLRGYLRSHDGSHYFIHPVSPTVAHRVKRTIVELNLKPEPRSQSLNKSLSEGMDSPNPRGIQESRERIHRLLNSYDDTHIIIQLERGEGDSSKRVKVKENTFPSQTDDHYCPLDHLLEKHAHIIDPLSVYKNNLLKKIKVVPSGQDGTNHLGNKVRKKREPDDGRSEATVEIGLFYDEDLYTQTQVKEHREEKIMDYVLNVMNMVGLLLTHSSLGISIIASLVRLEIFEKQPDTLRTKDATALLEAFREFQMDSNPMYDYGNRKNWDNAILLTGMNMYQNIYSNGQLKKVQSIAGLAGIGTMCHNKFSASIIEAKGYRSAYSIAHEMGHNFGMVHDGVSYASRCENEGYIMSPHTGMGTNKWSECSREIISDTLKYFTCLYETSDTPWKLTFPVQNVLPGQRISADQQCEAFVGKGSRRFKGTQIESICYYLWCTQPNNDYFAYGTHPALDGTYCGWNKWCKGGICQPWPLNHGSETANGGWTSWNADSGCTYNCMVEGSGIFIWTRKCENPIPLNGGDECVGEKAEYEICEPTGAIAQRCEKFTVQQYIDDTCQKKSSRTSPYLGGSQYAHNSKVPTHACHVYCQRSDTGEYVPSGLLPDGSLCHIDENDSNYYCVYGRCKKPINNAQELPF